MSGSLIAAILYRSVFWREDSEILTKDPNEEKPLKNSDDLENLGKI